MPHDDITRQLAGGLPAFMPSSSEDDNYTVLEAFGSAFLDQELRIETVSESISVGGDAAADLIIEVDETVTIPDGEYHEYNTVDVRGSLIVEGEIVALEVIGSGNITGTGTVTVTEGFAIDRLRELGRLVQVAPLEGSDFARYRARLIAEFSTATGKGTIEDVLDTAGRILDISVESIGYTEPPDSGSGVIILGLPGAAIDDSALTESDITDALDRTIVGSYRLEATATGTFTYITTTDYSNGLHTASQGYDGLDTNGDPKDNGGTYAGLLN